MTGFDTRESEAVDGPVHPALGVMNLSKSFGPNHALRDVSLSIRPGTIEALIGGNGSGKSTLIKVLAGVHAADGGEIAVRGETYDARSFSAQRAWDCGLRFVHQHASVFPELTVAENIAIGDEFRTSRIRRIKWAEQVRHAAELLARFEIDAHPREEMRTLGPATQTMIAVARALQGQYGKREGILVMDEPTASLPASEVEILLTALRRFAAAGQSILYVSHRLDEILDVADHITALRDGVVVGRENRDVLTYDRLVELIAGRSAEDLQRSVQATRAVVRNRVVLSVDRLSGGPVRSASFEMRGGEIVGVAGLLGSGRTTLLRLLFGARARESGEVSVEGRPVHFRRPTQAIADGMAYVPEDRAREAAFADLSVSENLSVTALDRYWRWGWLSGRREAATSAQLVTSFGVKCVGPQQPLGSLSGGNQQKVILARWIQRSPKVLLLDEPTQGVDVGARAEIYALIQQVAAKGTAVLLVSSDAEELELLCDRVLIIQKGEIAAELTGAAIDDERLEQLVAKG